MARPVVKLSNELIVFIPELDWTPELMTTIKASYTSQIIVDDVMHFITPFGAHMLCVHMTVTRAHAVTYDLREYLCRLLNRSDIGLELNEIHAPSRARLFRVA